MKRRMIGVVAVAALAGGLAAGTAPYAAAKQPPVKCKDYTVVRYVTFPDDSVWRSTTYWTKCRGDRTMYGQGFELVTPVP